MRSAAIFILVRCVSLFLSSDGIFSEYTEIIAMSYFYKKVINTTKYDIKRQAWYRKLSFRERKLEQKAEGGTCGVYDAIECGS